MHQSGLLFARRVVLNLVSISVLLIPAFSQDSQIAKTPKPAWDEMLAKSKLVENELANDNVPEWAGKYHWGSLGFSGATMLVSPKSGFVFRPYTDYFPNDIMDKFDFGPVEADDSRIYLRSTRNFFGDERFYFVKWGERSLLVPESYIPLLINFFNAGCSDVKAYSDVGHMHFPTKAEEVRKRLSGRPTIPTAFEPLLLKSPLTAKITSTVGTRIKKQFPDSATHFWYDQYTAVVLNAGLKSGVWAGMNLFGRVPGGATFEVRITKVAENTSEGEVYRSFEGKEPAPPPPGFVFSSRLDEDLLDHRIRPRACI